MIRVLKEQDEEFGNIQDTKETQSIIKNSLKNISLKNRFKFREDNNGVCILTSPNEMIALAADQNGNLSVMTKAATFQGDDIDNFFSDIVASQEVMKSISEELDGNDL